MNNIILIIGVLVVFTILFLFVTLKIRRIILNMNNIKGFINVVIDNNVKELENAVHVLRIYINSMTAELNHTFQTFLIGISLFVIINLIGSIFVDIYPISFAIGFVIMSVPFIMRICSLVDDTNEMINIIESSFEEDDNE